MKSGSASRGKFSSVVKPGSDFSFSAPGARAAIAGVTGRGE